MIAYGPPRRDRSMTSRDGLTERLAYTWAGAVAGNKQQTNNKAEL